MPEYSIEREAWLNIVDTLLDEGYHFDLIHAQNSASYYREGQKLLPHHTCTCRHALYGSRPYSALNEYSIKQSLTVKVM